ncbi:MAG: alkaline phosphatase family protein [Balneolales bacterium]
MKYLPDFLVLCSRLLLVALMIAGVYYSERTFFAESDPATIDSSTLTSHKGTSGSKVFVLVVDGLAYRTAMDPMIMPHLAEMRQTGSFAQVKTTYEAYSSSALRAAFSGTSQNTILGVVNNFSHRNVNIQSIFTEIQHAQLQTAIYSNGHFNQFGNVFLDKYHRFEGEEYLDADKRNPKTAFEYFKAGEADLVIAHFEMTDWAGHEYGTLAEEYRNVHTHVDSLIGVFHHSLDQEELLMVMGDHGLSERGEHKTGMDLPTYLSLTGKSYRKNVDLGLIDITLIRDFIALSMGLPINQYQSNIDFILPAFTRDIQELIFVSTAKNRTKSLDYALFIGFLLTFVLLFVIWLYLNHYQNYSISLYFVAGIMALVFSPAHWIYFQCIAHTIACVFIIKRYFIEELSLKIIIPVVMALTVAILFSIFDISAVIYLIFSAAALVISLFGVHNLSKKGIATDDLFIMLSLVILAIFPAYLQKTGFIKFSPIGAYGLFICIMIFVIHFRTFVTIKTGLWMATAGLGLLLLVSPYRWSETPAMLFSPQNVMEIIFLYAAGMISKLYIYSRQANNGSDYIIGAVALTVVIIPELMAINVFTSFPDKYYYLFFCVAFLFSYRYGLKNGRKYISEISLISLLFLLLYHLIQIPIYSYFLFDIAVASFLLISNVIFRLPDHAIRYAYSNLFPLVSIIIASSILIIGTQNGMEWRFLFQWFSAAIVEKYIVFFLPLILLKFLIPVYLLNVCTRRYLLSDEKNDITTTKYMGVYFASLFLGYLGIAFIFQDYQFFKIVIEQTAMSLFMLFAA